MSETKKVKQKLSIRQQKAKREILKGTPARKALRIAGYSPKTADKDSKAVLAKLGIAELMEKRGLTDDRLLDVLADGLKANKVISANIINKSGDGMADAHSTTKDFIDVEDHHTRHKYLETGLKLKGHLRDNKTLDIPQLNDLSDKLAAAIARKRGK